MNAANEHRTPGSILITGCSSGIGLDAALTLHKLGWQVLATCRQQQDCEKLQHQGLTSFPLDYADEQSVSDGAEQALALTAGQLTAVFNNGAFGIPGAVEDLPRGALRSIFETNLFGQLDLTNRLIPNMRKNGYGKLIFCSSVLGFAAMPFRGAYNSTKFAMEGLVDTLRLELRGSGIDVVLIEPGPIATRIRENSIPHFERWIDWENSAVRDRYERQLRPRLYQPATRKDRFELPASAVTAKLRHALEHDPARPRYFVTKPTWVAAILKRLLSTRGFDRVTAGR